MTFSLVARCPETGMFGMAISSSSPAVAARCVHVRAGVGAVASQNVTDPALGPLILDRMAAGADAPEALFATVDGRAHVPYRQLMVIGRAGDPVLLTGAKVLGTWGHGQGRDCAAAGNLLAHREVPVAMVAAFGAAGGHLADRLMTALEAGFAAGGEAGPVHSAGLCVADRLSWPLVDLRVDWSDDPIGDLRALWTLYRPQMQAYVDRAENPGAAPSYGVPGDR
ncbi:MAG: DUF1028 domain-containing protein [Gemmobacter sp.]